MPNTSNKPSDVSSHDGEVHIQGPHGVDVTMTPAAAFETAQRIDAAAIDAILDTVSSEPGAPETAPSDKTP